MTKQHVKHDGGQDLIEYALLAALLAVATMGALSMLSDPLTGIFAGILAMLRRIIGM